MKPNTDARNTRRRPMLPASQPLSGVMMAVATMYEVSTQDICSCVLESEPWICGGATFAMVVSSADMIDAPITDSVMSPRWATSRSATGAAALIDWPWLLPAGRWSRHGTDAGASRCPPPRAR